MKIFYSVVVVSLVAFVKSEDTQIDWFDCSHSPDGNHAHPRDCFRFVACSGGVAYDRGCDVCHLDNPRCANGYMIYNSTNKICMWADETVCEVGSDDTTTVVPNPMPTEGPNPDRPPQEGDSCNPEECINFGYCQGYFRCDKKAGKWVKEECGENLAWNPLNPNGTNQVHGGNCDIWDNLSNDVVRRYRTDTDCLACFWKGIGSCSREYDYQPANGTHRNVLRLSCGDKLVFSQEKETCQRCEDVKGDDGNACC